MLVSDFVFVCAALTQEPLQSIDFQRDVRPILSDKCFACHGPDAAARKADLRLDTREGALADLGGYVAIVPGGAEESELIYRITSEDKRELMPPPESGHSLTDEERDTLRAWVDQGAEYAPHWSFVPVDSVLSPAVTEEWARDEIDSYVLHRMKMAGLDPQRDAVDEDWLRRVSFVLTGLPPTMELITGFPSELKISPILRGKGFVSRSRKVSCS